MKSNKVSLCTYERAAIHAKLGKILKRGNPAEILLIVYVLLALRPYPRLSAPKKKRQPKRLP